jgi:Protein of unknown function (DUF3108)
MRILPLVALFLSTTPVLADTLVKARYEITVAGFRIGIAGLEGQFSDQAYAAGVSVKLSGLAKLMAAGEGSVEAEGRLSNGKAAPANYKLHLNAGDKKEDVAFNFSGANVNTLSAQPHRPDPQGTIPLKPNHKSNVLDPLSAGVFTSSDMASAFNTDTCNKSFPIFDGRQRYDMTFSYARKEPLKAIGYRGEALVCNSRHKKLHSSPHEN